MADGFPEYMIFILSPPVFKDCSEYKLRFVSILTWQKHYITIDNDYTKKGSWRNNRQVSIDKKLNMSTRLLSKYFRGFTTLDSLDVDLD